MKMKASFRARHLAIVGLGLMGGSLALALRQYADRITGIDLDAAARAQALHRRLVDCATADLQAGVNHADVVILATPVRGYYRDAANAHRLLPALPIRCSLILAAPSKTSSTPWPSCRLACKPLAGIR